MRLPRVRFTIRRMMVAVAAVAVLIPAGQWAKVMLERRAHYLGEIAKVRAYELMAQKLLATPNIESTSYKIWSEYADLCRRNREHLERVASRPWEMLIHEFR